MCGINGFLSNGQMTVAQRIAFFSRCQKIVHRGPDRSVMLTLNSPVNAMISFERLSIMDPSSNGDQPFKYEHDGHTVYCMCNGEIYNHHEISVSEGLSPVSGSDCEVIPLLYRKYGLAGLTEMMNMLNSEHAFAILDIDQSTGNYVLVLSTDRFGLRPLFVGTDSDGFYFSSELQGLPADSTVVRFPPRHYAVMNGKDRRLSYHQYYEFPTNVISQSFSRVKSSIVSLLTNAVNRRLDSDRPLGCLLSGGLDSSLVAALAAKRLREFGRTLRTFSIGLPGSTDGPFAVKVAKHINSNHQHIEVTEEDFLHAIPDIIKTIGSFDITTVRASVGQYLISKWISEHTDIKVLLCGDGADECQAGYMYFHNAPSAHDAHNEAIRLLSDIHLYDGLRADRCISRWGLEARFPMLDWEFVDFYLSTDPSLRVPGRSSPSGDRMEKWLTRESFNDLNLIPPEVLWRYKTAFSDGVSSTKKSWFQIIQEDLESVYPDDCLDCTGYSHLPPVSKESLHYRKIFSDYFGEGESVAQTIPYYWLPKWCGNITEPSARVLSVCQDK